MKFIITTKDGKQFVKLYHRAATVLTERQGLAMRFNSLSEANRVGMVALSGEFQTRKVGK